MSKRTPAGLLGVVRFFLHRVIAQMGTRGRETWAYTLVFALAAATIGLFLYLHITSSRQEAISYWQERQSRVAEVRAQIISAWLTDRQADVQLLATRSSLHYALSAYHAAGRTLGELGRTSGELRDVLNRMARLYNYSGVYLLDRDAKVVMQSSHSAPLNPSLAAICRAVAQTSATRIDLLADEPARSVFVLSAPVFPGVAATGGGAASTQPPGVALVTADASQTLFPLITRESVPTQTGETVLVRREGNDVVFFAPLRLLPPGSSLPRLPYASAPLPARRALEGESTSLSTRDYRGVPVLAATQPIPLTGWGLVRKIDRAEALEDFRHEAIAESLAGFFLLALVASLLVFHRRNILGYVRQQEGEKFRALLESAPDAIYVIEPSTLRIMARNRAAAQMDGYTNEDVAHMTAMDLHPPEDHKVLSERFARVAETGPDMPMRALHHRRKDGRLVPVEERQTLVHAGGEKLVLSIVRDVTERRRRERELRRLNRALRTISWCNQAVVRAENEPELLDTVCKAMVKVGGYQMAWVGYAEPDEARTVRPVSSAGFEDGYLAQAGITWADNAQGRGPTGGAIRTGQVVINGNTTKDSSLSLWREEALKRGYASSIGLPLRVGGQTLGALTLYANEPDAFDDQEVKLLSELADDLAFGIETIRSRDERQRVEQALRESEERFRGLVQNSTVGIYRTTPDGRILMANPALVHMLGFESLDELAARNLEAEGFEPGYPRHTFREQVEKDGIVSGLEAVWRRRDRSEIYVRESARAIRDGDGRVLYYDGIVEDISERKRVEDTLREREERYRVLFERNLAGIAQTSLDGRIQDCNEAYARTFGFASPADAQGHMIQELWFDPAERELFVSRARQEGTLRNVELRLRRTDGQAIWVLENLSLVEPGEGREPFFEITLVDITERKRVEIENARLADIVSASDDTILSTDPEGIIVTWNAGAERMFGYTEEEIKGKHFTTFIPVDQREGLAAINERLQRGEVIVHIEHENLRKDGSRFPVSVSLSPLKDAAGVVTGVSAIVRDVTERKRAEEALKNEKAFTESVVEGLPNIFFVLDSEGRYLRGNKNVGEILGYSDAELAAIGPLAAVAEDQRSLIASKIQEAMAKGSAVAEANLLTKDGRGIPHLLTAMRADIGGSVYLVGIGVDITERKRAEEDLRESERKYRQLHDSMIDGFVRTDMEGKITEANDAFCKMLGYTPEELRGLTNQNLTPERWHDNEKEIIEEEVLTRGYSEVYLKEYQHKGGIIIPVELRQYLMLDESGGPCGMWAIVRDITERKWAEEMLQEYEKVVEGSDEMIAVIDREYHHLLANRAYLNQNGVERGDLFGYSIPELLGEEFFASVVKPKLDECFQGNAVRYETKYEYPRLGTRDLQVSYFPIEGVRGIDRVACVLQDITERKRAEAALYEERHLLHTLMDNLPDFIYFKDRESRHTRINLALAKEYGLNDPAQAVGKSDFDFSVPERAEEFYRDEQEIIRTGQPLVGKEEQQTRSDGRVTWLSTTKMPLRDISGNIIGTFGVSRDITESKRAEAALRESEEGLAAAQRIMHIGSWRWNVRTDVAHWSDETIRIFGLTPGQLDDQRNSFLAMIHPADRARVEQAMTDALNGTGKYAADYRFLRPDGTEKVIHAEGEVLIDEAGNPLIMQGTNQDITERRRAEAERTRLIMAIEQSAEAVMMTNPHGVIEYVNPAFTRITGYSPDEVLGKTPRILKSGRQTPGFYRQLWDTIKKGEIWRGETVNRGKDGKLYTEEMTIAPVRGEHGEITQFIATMQDVTERKVLEEQVRRAAKMEAVGRLAGGVAHDFNNLLTIINGYADLLTDTLAADHKACAHLGEIKSAGDRAASLTRQLLAFSRQQVLAPQVLDLNSAVSNLEKMLRRLIGEDITLRTVLDSSLQRVKADPGQIEQVIMNLVVNARDAMPSGGTITIETHNVKLDEAFARTHVTVQPGPHVMLAVADTGIGMDAVTQARIFEPFFTTKELGKGTGLGLATVYGIVKQSGGSIWVYSELGQGTVFKVYFPVVREAVAKDGDTKPEPETTSGKETIMVVEDEKGLRSLIQSALKSSGYNVLDMEDGKSALELCASYDGPIHLLLTDVVMPQMSGPVVAEKITALRPGIKVLYMSGYTDDAVTHHGVFGPDTPFMQKPFSPEALRKRVRKVLDGE